MSRIKSVAIHEASHAIIGYLDGFEPTRISLWQDPKTNDSAAASEYEIKELKRRGLNPRQYQLATDNLPAGLLGQTQFNPLDGSGASHYKDEFLGEFARRERICRFLRMHLAGMMGEYLWDPDQFKKNLQLYKMEPMPDEGEGLSVGYGMDLSYAAGLLAADKITTEEFAEIVQGLYARLRQSHIWGAIVEAAERLVLKRDLREPEITSLLRSIKRAKPQHKTEAFMGWLMKAIRQALKELEKEAARGR